MSDAEVSGKVVRKRGGKTAGQTSHEPDSSRRGRRWSAVAVVCWSAPSSG